MLNIAVIFSLLFVYITNAAPTDFVLSAPARVTTVGNGKITTSVVDAEPRAAHLIVPNTHFVANTYPGRQISTVYGHGQQPTYYVPYPNYYIPQHQPVYPPAVNPGQYPRQYPGQYPGQVPAQYPGQVPAQYPGQVPAQIPGQIPAQPPVFGTDNGRDVELVETNVIPDPNPLKQVEENNNEGEEATETTEESETGKE